MPFVRITLMKLPKEALNEAAQDYTNLQAEALTADGEKYLISSAGIILERDERSQGYNVAGRVEFKSAEDIEYYDKECKAHAALKEKYKKSLAGPPLVICWNAEAHSKPPSSSTN